MKTCLSLVLSVFSLSFAQAADTNSVAGTWTGTPTPGQLGVTKTTYEFSTNSVFRRSIEYVTMSAIAAMRNPRATMPTNQISGKYWIETNKLSFVFEGYEWMTNVATYVLQEDTLVLMQDGATNRFTRKE